MTPRQREILKEIEDYYVLHGRPPTLARMADVFGVGINAIVGHVKALRKKGEIDEDSLVPLKVSAQVFERFRSG